jgi:hypothetical protein
MGLNLSMLGDYNTDKECLKSNMETGKMQAEIRENNPKREKCKNTKGIGRITSHEKHHPVSLCWMLQSN